MTKDIDNSQDILDSRDIFERIEELEEAKDAFEETIKEWEDEILDLDSEDEDEAEEKFEIQEKIKVFGTWEESNEGIELKNLTDFMEDFKGYGGDEQWRGDWYPLTLVRDDYWVEYCEQELKDLGYIKDDMPFWIEIDYEKTAENMQQDYSSAEFDEVTYWAR